MNVEEILKIHRQRKLGVVETVLHLQGADELYNAICRAQSPSGSNVTAGTFEFINHIFFTVAFECTTQSTKI